MTTLSVLIPFYNESSACLRLIKDLEQQENPKNWNIEIIACNDGSEHIEQALLNYSKPNFQLIEHKKNQGLSTTRNTLIKKSTGEYLLFFDADIRLEKPNTLANYIEKIIAGFVCINAPLLFKGNQLLNQYQNKSWNKAPLKSACGLCIARSLITQLFDERLKHYGFEDKIFIMENNLHSQKPILLTNTFITHHDENNVDTYLKKISTAGKLGSKVIRKHHNSIYQQILYSKLDIHSSNYSKLTVLLFITAPILKLLVKATWPWLFNQTFPLLTAFAYAQGCKESEQ